MILSRFLRLLGVRVRRLLVLALSVAFVQPAPLFAQPDSTVRDSTRATQRMLDSLRARVTRTEADIALLRDQLATESASQVRLRSRVRLDLHARLLTSVYRTQAAGNALDLPLFARPSVRALPASAWLTGVQVRQSTFGASVTVDDVRGAAFLADIDLDLAGAAPTDGSPLFPLPRLRTMRAMLRWPTREVMMGIESPLISDLNPFSVAAVAVPNFATAGNLWNWIPQVRLTQTLWRWGRDEHAMRLSVQGAVLSPFANEVVVSEPGELDAAVRSGRPSLQSRLRLQWGRLDDEPTAQRVSDRGGEIGFGVHRGWVRLGGDTLSASRALSIDVRAGLTHGMELRGEAYRGRMLRGLGGGAVGQNFALPRSDGTRGAALENVAGWLQLNAQLHQSVVAGGGCGIDRVMTARAARERNRACASHISWRPAVPLLLDLEVRHLLTRGVSGVLRARHVNLAFGIEL
ncbi:MAG: hypothetical protein IT353_24425 [Gemmatimonadaceae bacterium]|nr:hypothetical protein [Gemmatimonadaceae bacterium]